MEKLLCPSMMCADFGALKREMEALEKAGFEILETNYQGEWVNITAKKC